MNNKIKTTLISLAAAALLTTQATSLFADDQKTDSNKPNTSHLTQQTPAWLGVTLSPIPTSLSAQLSDIIPQGQGVLVRSISKDSPAEKAGLKVNDVLLSLDDQKLYSASQLSGLIRTAKPDSEVKFSVVQKGKLKEIKVTLDKRKAQQWTTNPSSQNSFFNAPSWLSPQLAPSSKNGTTQGNQQQTKVFGSFESVQVRSLADGRYHAEVSYKNQSNETKKFTFEGKREEIIEQVKKHKQLPEDKKQALLSALEMNFGTSNPFAGLNNSLLNHPFFKQPFGQNSLFNSPFFQGNPFNDPFFQNGFANGSLFQRIPQMKMFVNPQPYQIQPMPQQTTPIQPNSKQKSSLI